ncbi:MAG: ABC-type transport system involved in multi-copper enzyme maturation permease subunit [Candidatus Promineifilaceae bacterium]|jgi:ABC-type transport system involved in multi-copper enzyme maturation permease subunit
MNLTTFVIARELKSAPRHKRFYLKRVSVVVLLAVVMALAANMGRGMGSTTVGLRLFSMLAFASLGGLSFIGMAGAVNLIVREKEERTLGLLLLTEVSGANIVWGKLFTALFGSTMILLSILPLILLAVSLGGVSIQQILIAIAVILSHSFLVGALGLLAASVTRSDRTATGTAGLFWVGAFLIVPWVLAYIGDETNIDRLANFNSVFMGVSPFLAMGTVVEGGEWLSALISTALSIALAIPIVRLAQRYIVKGAVSDSTRVGNAVEKRMAARRVRRRHARAPLAFQNPVFWRDFEFWLGGRRGSLMKFLVSVLALLVAFLWFALASKMRAAEFGEAFIWTALLGSALINAFGTVALCSQAFHKEKKFRAMEPLLTTDLSDREILWGKVRAIAVSMLPWGAATLFFAVLALAVFGHDHDVHEVATVMIVEYLTMLFGYSWLAFWLSLRFKRNTGFGIAFLVFIVWNSFGRMFFAMSLGIYQSMDSVVTIDALFHVAMGAICMAVCFANFRTRALAHD